MKRLFSDALPSFEVDCSFLKQIKEDFQLIPTIPDWVPVLGVDPEDNLELFLERAILGASQQFNFWQDKRGNLSSSIVFQWVRKKIDWNLIDWNLLDYRLEINFKVTEFLNHWRPLTKALAIREFWDEMNWAFNPFGLEDPYFKKPILVKYILEAHDLTELIYQADAWGWACVDYNLPIALNHYGIIQLEKEYYQKDEFDQIRKQIYAICFNMIQQKQFNPVKLDSFLYQTGRLLRKQYGDHLIPKVLNETNY